MVSFCEFIEDNLKKRLFACGAKEAELHDALAFLSEVKNDKHFTFYVLISNKDKLMSEGSVLHQEQGPLSCVMRNAICKFKKINRRENIKAKCAVLVEFSSGCSVNVPSKFFMKYCKKYGKM